MNISHIEHIGIAVPSLEEAIPFYENILGLKCFADEEDDIERGRVDEIGTGINGDGES